MLPVCRDFNAGKCTRPQCKYVHLKNENVQIVDGNVIICKNALFEKCNSSIVNNDKCKYYHIPEDILSMQIFNYQIKYQQNKLEPNYYYY